MARPQVSLKLATSLDGRIALANGVSQWITGPEARARVQEMRAAHSAVMVGIGTVLADDPLLTARTQPPPKVQPVRIVADTWGRMPLGSQLAQSVDQGRVVVGTGSLTEVKRQAFEARGLEVWVCGQGDTPESEQSLNLQAFLRRAWQEGLTSLFLEGGSRLAASFLRAGLVDRLYWFRAPIILGGDGLAAIGALGLEALEAAPAWQFTAREQLGRDVLETYIRAELSRAG